MGEDIILKMQYKQLYIKVSLIFIIYFLIVFIMKNSIELTPFFILSFFILFLVLFVIKTQIKDSNKVYKQIDMLYYNLLNERKSHNSFDEVSNSLDLIINDVKNRIIDIEKLSKHRSQFLGNVSHELKTPIFTLQGYIDTLLDGAIDDTEVNKDFMKKIKVQSERIESLLTDLIKISMIESKETKLNKKTILLSDIIDEINNKYTNILKSRGDKLILPDVKDIMINVDKESILSVFDNLITNAINYSDRGDVIISVKYNNDKIIISVIDHGIGIDEKQIERIFERFYRVDSDRSRSSGGTGLGLSIVKHILLAHDSNIEVKSQSSIGSTFSFSLPVLKN